MNGRLGLILSLVTLLAYPSGAVKRPKHAHKRPHAATAQARPRWITLRNDELKVALRVPAAWKARRDENAVGFTSPTPKNRRAAIGVLRSQMTGSIEEAADHHYDQAGRPASWRRTPVRVAGRRAIKIVTVDPARPGMRVVHYYVESSAGPYLIQCMAPTRAWSVYSPVFAKFLSGIKFL